MTNCEAIEVQEIVHGLEILDCPNVELNLIEDVIAIELIEQLTVNNAAGEGDAITKSFEADETLGIDKVVYVRSNGRIALADKDAAIDFNDVIGFTKNNALAGEIIDVTLFGGHTGTPLGSISDSFWLGNGGAVVTTAPTSGIVLHVGTQAQTNEVCVRIGKPFKRS